MTTYVHVHHTKFILFCTIITIHVHAIGGWVKNLIQDGFTHYTAIYINVHVCAMYYTALALCSCLLRHSFTHTKTHEWQSYVYTYTLGTDAYSVGTQQVHTCNMLILLKGAGYRLNYLFLNTLTLVCQFKTPLLQACHSSVV